MNISKTCLFGGALAAAGVANAQQFVISDASPYSAYASLATSYAIGSYSGGVVSYAAGGSIAGTSDSSAYGSAFGDQSFSTSVSSNNARVEADWNGGGAYGFGYGYAVVQMFFQVDQDADLVISWDVSNTDGYTSSFVLEDVALGATLHSNSPLLGGPLAGSETISLSAGVDYQLNLAMLDLSAGTGFPPFVTGGGNFINAELVPAPGAMGVLGLAGLAATRRRRS